MIKYLFSFTLPIRAKAQCPVKIGIKISTVLNIKMRRESSPSKTETPKTCEVTKIIVLKSAKLRVVFSTVLPFFKKSKTIMKIDNKIVNK